MADRTITTDLIGRDRMSGAFDSAGRSAQRSGGIFSKVGSVMGTALKGGAVAAGGGILALGAWIGQGVKDAASYQTVLAKTAQVLKTTGAVSGQSVEGIKAQAAALETLSGVDEELIINSQNVLATFTNIRNVGKQKIFDLATQSALDMSVALGSDLQGASIQLGKALNDPIKGVGALSKVGVTFTEQQKKTIAALVKTGDTAGAQKVILKELSKEFGGAAQAAGAGFEGSLARAQDVLADTGRTIGESLLPVVTDLVDWFGKKFPPAFEVAQAAVKSFVAAFNGEGIKGEGIAGKAAQAGEAAAVAFKAAQVAVKVFAVVVGNPVFQAFALTVVSMVVAVKAYNTALAIGAAATRGYAAAQAALNVVMSLNPIGLVVLAVVALAAAFVIAYKRSETFRVVVQAAFKVTANAILTAVSSIIGVFRQMFGVLGHLPGKAGAAFRSAERAAIAAKGKVDGLRESLNRVKSKTVAIRVNTTYAVYGNKGGSYQGGTFVPNREFGGPVRKGQPYVVGEKRPELFIPDVNGRIAPDLSKIRAGSSSRAAGGGGGGGDTYVFHVSGVVANSYSDLAETLVKALEKRPAGSRKIPASAIGRR